MLSSLFLCLQFVWSISSTPITVPYGQQTNLSTLHPQPDLLNTTILGVQLDCFPFRITTRPPLMPTNLRDCELAMDNWVRGHNLNIPRTFGRNPSSRSDDVLLPIVLSGGSCFIQMDTVSEDDEDTLTLAEIYAEVMGPDGVVKQCLGPGKPPGLGGRMLLGMKGLVRVFVTGGRSRFSAF